MTEIEKQALALLQECGFHGGYVDRKWNEQYEALCRALEQKAALQAEFDQNKRDMSDAVEKILNCTNVNKRYGACLALNRFILPKSVDPLVEAMNEMGFGCSEGDAKGLRDALAKRNARIVWEIE